MEAFPKNPVLEGGLPMSQTVYVDILLAVNLFIHYFLLLATAKFLGIPRKAWRMAASSCLGAAYSLAIFLPALPVYLDWPMKLGMSASLVWLAFSFRGWKPFAKAAACFFAMNFAFAGFLLAVWYLAAPPGLVVKNSVVYLPVSPLCFLGATVVCYGILQLLFRFIGRQEARSALCQIQIARQGSTVVCTAKVDTGNSLVEPFSHTPVIVAEYQAVQKILPEEMRRALQREGPFSIDTGWEEIGAGIRMVPFHSVSGEGVLPAFLPDDCVLFVEKRQLRPEKVYIAVCRQKLGGGDFSALLPPDLLESAPVKRKAP